MAYTADASLLRQADCTEWHIGFLSRRLVEAPAPTRSGISDAIVIREPRDTEHIPNARGRPGIRPPVMTIEAPDPYSRSLPEFPG